MYPFLLALMLVAWASLAGAAALQLGDSLQPQGPELADHRSTPSLSIELHGDRLSVQAHQAPWAAVLPELERHTGILIRLEGPLSGTLTDAFATLPLEQGLRRLFRHTNSAFFYGPGPIADPAAGRLLHVWLFPREEEGAEPGRVRQPPAAAAVAAQETEGPLATEESQESRLSALQGLARQGDVEALRKAVFDPDQTIQATAFDLLAEQDYQGAKAILADLTRSDQPERRLQALQLLHQSTHVDHETVLAVLGEALTDADVTVKRSAIQTLAERGGPDAQTTSTQPLRWWGVNPTLSVDVIPRH